MTLIAAVNMNRNPAVFGDLIISGPEQPGRTAHIPAVGDATNVLPAGSEYAILGLKQKVILLADNCAVGWSGTEIVARMIVRELRAIASQAPLTSATIGHYLSKLDPIDQRQVTFVGWVHEGDHFEQFWFDASIGESALFGRIAAGGSGADAFIGLASQISASMPTDQAPTMTGLDRIVVPLVSAMGLLLRAELASQSTLLHLFGGGYEIATFVGNKFEKIGDILFFFWSAVVSDTQAVELHAPALIIKQDYVGETLLLHTLRLIPGNVAIGPPAAMIEDKHVIGPFGVKLTDAEARTVPWPGMEAKYICHVVFVRSPDNLGVLTRINYSPSRKSKDIRFSVADGNMSFEASGEFFDSLTQSVRAEYGGPAT